MKRIKKSVYLFLISFVFTSCLVFGFFGACVVYENTVKVAYGEYKTAVSIHGGKIRIFDFEFNIVS
ncbi:MAG: hypothetical protein IKN39_00485 [Clostridia bacterium]|nr:hypothetical protein [Clostridia bacterium]